MIASALPLVIVVLCSLFFLGGYFAAMPRTWAVESWDRKDIKIPAWQGSRTKNVANQATTFFVKEYIIVTQGLTYVWWKAKGVMDYELYKVVYHTGDTVYYHGDNKVFRVVDASGKQW